MMADLVSEGCDFEALPDPERRYPVLVTYTERHVVWIEAGTVDEAVEQVRNHDDVCELTSPASRYLDDREVQPPDRYDWQFRSGVNGGSHGPWRRGEPPHYNWRQWEPEYVARIEARMASATAADPDCETCHGAGEVVDVALVSRETIRSGECYAPCATCRPVATDGGEQP